MNPSQSALVLAGGKWQSPLIRYLKSQNFKVTVVDPYEDSAGVLIGDDHVKLDVRNVDSIYEAVKERNFTFVLSDQSDVACEAVAELSKRLGTPSNLPSAAEFFWNKSKTAFLAAKLNIATPRYEVCGSLEEFLTKASNFPLPVVVKPVDSQSSRGISKLINTEHGNLVDAFESAFSQSKVKEVLIQDCIEGQEVTVEGYASKGHHKCLAISSKRHVSFGIACELLYPAEISKPVENEIVNSVDTFVEATGLRFGITHAELIIDKASQKPYLIEVACRGGGTLISSDIVPWCSGVNLYDCLMKDLSGIDIDYDFDSIERKAAVLSFFCFKPGIVTRVLGLDEARRVDGVHALELEFGVGDTLKDPRDDRSRHGYVIIFAESREEVCDRLERVKSFVGVEY